MRPAAAMGLFVQTWRAEWAGLSRAQLAIAVSARLQRRQGVTARVIRRWEEGQPPSTTEELEGLCDVMRRSGLRQCSVRDYRSSVYGALADHQYPELFDGPPLADRPDVEDVARAMFERYADGDFVLPDAVQLVALFTELRSALASPSAHRVGRRQVRAQQAACCSLHRLVGETAFSVNWRVLAEMEFAAAHSLHSCFGADGLDWHVELKPRNALAYSLHVRASHGRCLASAEAMMAMFRGGPAADRPADWASGFLGALNNLSRLGEVVYPELRPEAERCWETVRDALPPDSARHCRVNLLDVACRHGLLAEAEEHLAGLEPWRDAAGSYEPWWYDYASTLATAAGRVSQAEEWYAKGLDAAERHDDPFYERYFARQLGLGQQRGARQSPCAVTGRYERHAASTSRSPRAAP